MTLVMNKLLDPKMTKDSDKKEKEEPIIRKPDDDTMFSWNGISLFDTEENTPQSECTSATMKGMGLIIEDNAIMSKINNLQEKVKRQVKMNVEDKTPEVTPVNQDTKPISKPVKPVKDW